MDCFTIALGKKTGTTFPITFNNKHNYNALYDTGAGASLINYSAYVSFIKNASGEDMGALGQVTCTFTINNQPFTQSFIVCRHMQQPVILGMDFTSTNFISVIWTPEGTRKMIRSNGSRIFADISRPLTTLVKKDAKFEWTSTCQKSFELLKEALFGKPVLKYADTSKPYTLYTDASKFGWAGVLTQPHTMTIDGKSTTTDHPVAFVSGLFRGSQLNWAALMKEAFAIYMSVKNLSFYLTDAQILLRSDHKPLEKFSLKNRLNSKVNNWAMELEAFNIQFDHIKGSNNILVDTLSRLIAIDPDTPTMQEELGYEFGYAIFEEFPKVQTKTYEVNKVIVGTDKEIIKNDPELQNSLQSIENPIAPQRLRKLQQQDTNIEILKHKLQNNRLDKEYYSLDENELLTRKVIDGGHKFRAIYLPSVLIFQVL